MTARIGIGFDGMCADVSILGLTEHLERIQSCWPRLAPLMASLRDRRDEELTCEAEGIAPEEFFRILADLQNLPRTHKDVHIGANCALETVTAANLLSDPVPPVPQEAAIDYLGFWSPATLQRVPEKIPQEYLERARCVENSEAVSLIMPEGGKRSILSFGGSPPVRSLSRELREYLETDVPAYLEHTRADFLIVVGTACTFSAARTEDFALLRRVICRAQAGGTTVLVDLGGLGSWKAEALTAYFDVLSEADILSMNESEIAVYYGQKTGLAGKGTTATELASMISDVIRPGQRFLVHTPFVGLAAGFPQAERRIVEEALCFAAKAATVRGITGKFPTAREVQEAQLPLSDRGREEAEAVPDRYIAVPGCAGEVVNPVGLGDTWTCSFILAYVGARQ